MPGTKIDVQFVRGVDGDTIRIMHAQKEEPIRILALDTEESSNTSSKPVTPWGKAASEEAIKFFENIGLVSLEFPSNEPVEECLEKYRGNYGRLLAYVYHPNGTDFQEYMIQKGYSPYFVKYGYADFPENHQRYTQAERQAQSEHIGVWDQIEVNGSEIRNYAGLCVWWHLRAQIIDSYRRVKATNPDPPIYNTRLDYQRLKQLAGNQETITVFSELREVKRVGANHAVVRIGSIQQPFEIFIPNVDAPHGVAILNLLTNRYLPGDLEHPRRSYAYVHGPASVYKGRPQIKATDPNQFSDWPP